MKDHIRRSNTRAARESFQRRCRLVPGYPISLEVCLDSPLRCNGRCLFCLGDGRQLPPHDQLESTDWLADTLLGEVVPHVERLSWTSHGEPLVNRRFMEFLRDPSPEPTVRLQSNGLLLKRRMDDLLGSPKPIELGISLHAATAATHSLVVGCSEKRFDEIVDALRTMVQRRDADALPKTFSLLLVTMRLNVREVADFVRLASDIGVDSIILMGLEQSGGGPLVHGGDYFDYRGEMIFRGDPEFEAQLEQAHEHLDSVGFDRHRLSVILEDEPPADRDAVSERDPLPLPRERDRSEPGPAEPPRESKRPTRSIRDVVEGLGRDPGATLLSLERRLSSTEDNLQPDSDLLVDSLAYLGRTLLARSTTDPVCERPWRSGFIDEQGDVRCCSNRALVLGSLRGRTFGEVWNGWRARLLRRVFAAGRLPYFCVQCDQERLVVLEDEPPDPGEDSLGRELHGLLGRDGERLPALHGYRPVTLALLDDDHFLVALTDGVHRIDLLLERRRPESLFYAATRYFAISHHADTPLDTPAREAVVLALRDFLLRRERRKHGQRKPAGDSPPGL